MEALDQLGMAGPSGRSGRIIRAVTAEPQEGKRYQARLLAESLLRNMFEDPNQAGVYYILHVRSSKVYVGSGLNIRGRWKGHRSALKNNKHANKYLQHAWNKYGEAEFEWGVLEVEQNPNLLLKKEQFWIDAFNATNRSYGYNICTIAGNSRGRKASSETRAKMSQRLKGNRYTLGRKLTDAHKRKISLGLVGKVHISQWQKDRISEKVGMIWEVTTPAGEVVVVRSLSKYAASVGVPFTTLYHLGIGNTKHNRRGWKCRRISLPRKKRVVSNGSVQQNCNDKGD